MVYVNSITVSPSHIAVFAGTWYYDLSAEVGPDEADNKNVTWHSDNPDVIAVNETTGHIYCKTMGTANIYATAMDGSNVSGVCSVIVQNPILVDDVTFLQHSIEAEKQEEFHLAAVVCPQNATNRSLAWSSSNPSVATVTGNGKVTTHESGIAVIQATTIDGSDISDCCTIRVIETANEPQKEEHQTDKNPENLVSDPIDSYSGAHLLRNTVMSLFGGQGLSLVAQYNSTQLVCGDLGMGWWHNFEKHLEVDENKVRVYNNPSLYLEYEAENDANTVFRCTRADKSGYVLTTGNAAPYPYILNCNSQQTEYYNICGDLAKIVDHQGFETLISYTDSLITITDGVSGKKLYLEKDSTCKIVRVYDDAARQATFTYTNHLLTSFCDVNGNTFTYTYDEKKRITSGTDANNVCYFQNQYDEYGRVIRQKDGIADSIWSTFVYENNKRIATNRNGKQSIREYNAQGLLEKYTDENGNVKTYEYDDRYNLVKETDGEGHSITKVYNSFNKPTEITDQNCHTTYITYNAVGDVVRICHPAVDGEIPQESFAYNNRNQMTSHIDRRGTITLYTYDTVGMPASKKVGNRNAELYTYENGFLKAKTDALGNTTRYTYNAIGQVGTETNADDKVTTYTHDAAGHILRVTDANGKSVVTTYDGNYQKTSVTDANGNKTEYSYNGNMKNDKVTLPDGNTIEYEFDGEDRPIKMIDQARNITQFSYDDGGRLVSKLFADDSSISYEYDKVGNVTKETNQKGATVTKTYDGLGNVLTVTDDDGNTTSYEYNAMSQVTKVTNAVAGTTVYEYSLAGDLLSETDALGNRKSYTYDDFGNRLTATDAKNNVTTYTYDANNNLLTVKDALNRTTTYTYDCLNRCVSVKDALNHTVRYGYDALGRRTTVTDAKNNVFTTSYDGNGNVIKTTDAKGNTVSETVYNCLNLPLTVTDAMGKTTTYTYNALGKVEIVADALNHRSQYTYNSLGQNIWVRDAANGTSRASYDLLGNVAGLVGPMGGYTSYTYDDMGRLEAETTPSGGTKRYEYNELNLRKKITTARGQVRQMFYDNMGRITGCMTPEGAVSYTYDANGNVLTVTDAQGTITRTYDELNRVSSCTDTYGNVIRYQYDAVGNLSKLIYPDNTAVNYAYDANHNLTRVTDWANRVTTYVYDVNNRVTQVIKPDNSMTVTVYDNMQRVTSTQERTPSGDVISGFEYTYDDLSRIVEEKDLANGTKMCYTYDVLNRVTKRTLKCTANNAVLAEESYSHDAAGNVTDAPDSCFTYDTNNRLTVFNATPVSYDAEGNMTYHDSLGFLLYDSANRLLSANGHSYTYNAEDVRIRNSCADEDTTYTYNTNGKLSQLLCKTTNGVITKYVYGHGLIGEEQCGAFRIYHFDFRGSTIALTDTCGNVTDTFFYDTYGKLISRNGTVQPIFGYNGRDGVVTDANGLIYMRARYYSPDMKRFINADIIAGSISQAVTLNRFAYANGNPVSFVDPFGLSVERGVQPTTLEAAYMAEHIYGAQRSDIGKTLAEKFGGWILADILTNSESLKIGIYTKTINGVVSYAFVNKGSSMEWSDWINNFQQPFGWSTDMEDSIKYAKDFAKQYSESQITFIGHSKGGAEAAANAVATNRDAILFNPATVSLRAYGLSSKTYSANMTAYIVKGEILNNIFGLFSAPIDKMEYLPAQHTSKWYNVVGKLGDSIKNHQMDAVISALGGK